MQDERQHSTCHGCAGLLNGATERIRQSKGTKTSGFDGAVEMLDDVSRRLAENSDSANLPKDRICR